MLSAECRVPSEDKKVGSQRLAVGRQEKEFLGPFILKTLWAYLKRIVLLRFLCFREEREF